MNIPKIPTIEQLRDFAQSYFDSGDCPTLQWEEIANGVAGQADREKNLIAITPNAEVNCIGCSIGIKGWDGYHYYESLKAEGLELTEGEQYFLTLLHISRGESDVFSCFDKEGKQLWLRARKARLSEILIH